MKVKCILSQNELKFLAAKYIMETLDIKGEPAPYKIKEKDIQISYKNNEYVMEVEITARNASEEPIEEPKNL